MGVFSAKLMWGYFGDFVSLLRNVSRYRDLPLADLLPEAFGDLTYVRVVRANKASWDAFFEHCGVRPTLVLYENFAADPQTSTLSVLDRLGLPAPADIYVEPRMKRQTDGINDDWVRRFCELRLGTEFDLVPAVARPVHTA